MKKIEELEQKLAEFQEEISKLKQQQNNQYPMNLVDLGSWPAIGSGNKYDFNKYLKFAELVETCKEWNRIDGFKPNYDDTRVIIRNFNNTVFISTGLVNGALMFKDYQTTQFFLETFQTELELVKDLL